MQVFSLGCQRRNLFSNVLKGGKFINPFFCNNGAVHIKAISLGMSQHVSNFRSWLSDKSCGAEKHPASIRGTNLTKNPNYLHQFISYLVFRPDNQARSNGRNKSLLSSIDRGTSLVPSFESIFSDLERYAEFDPEFGVLSDLTTIPVILCNKTGGFAESRRRKGRVT